MSVRPLIAALALGCGGAEAPGKDDATPVVDTPAADTDVASTTDTDPTDVVAARCARIKASVHDAGFDELVTVSCDGQFARLTADTYPSHPKMDGITGTNDQVPVPAPGYTSPVRLVPVRASAPTSIDAAVGVAVNGVPIYDYSSQGVNDPTTYDPKVDTKLTGELDQCNGHSGRGDDYHYHAAPICMIAAMKNQGPDAILGWGFDGYPLYGDANPDGTPIAAGELDVCNGKPDPVFGLRYHTSVAPPYVIGCLDGEVDVASAPKVSPLANAAGGGKPPGRKPPGGVTNLKLVEDADGTRTMSYDHQGTTYQIRYRPAATDGCWDFEERSYSTGGVLQQNTYCRRSP